MAKFENIELLINALDKVNNQWIEENVAKLQSKYCLFILVLADPKKDSEFYKLLQSKIKYCKRKAGKSIMLISPFRNFSRDDLVKSKKWYYKIFRKDFLKNKFESNVIVHYELAIQAICELMEIDYDKTPTLLLTSNLQSNKWVTLLSNKHILENQLLFLRNVINGITTQLNNVQIFNKLIQSNFKTYLLDIENADGTNSFPIHIIASTLSLLHNNRFREYDFDVFKLELQRYSSEINDDKFYEVFSLFIALKKTNEDFYRLYFKDDVKDQFNYMALDKLVGIPNPNIPKVLEREWNNIETSTFNHLYASGYILETMKDFMHRTKDFRLYALPLCVSFENEINLSVVQLIRKYLGVQMPDFFDKYCPTATKLPVIPSAELVPNPREIYFNNYGRKKWLPPGLGESRIGYKALKMNSSEFGSDWLNEELTAVFLKMWKNIQEIRNLVAHPGELGEEEKEKLEKSIMELHNSGLLNAITELKEKLRHLQN